MKSVNGRPNRLSPHRSDVMYVTHTSYQSQVCVSNFFLCYVTCLIQHDPFIALSESDVHLQLTEEEACQAEAGEFALRMRLDPRHSSLKCLNSKINSKLVAICSLCYFYNVCCRCVLHYDTLAKNFETSAQKSTLTEHQTKLMQWMG